MSNVPICAKCKHSFHPSLNSELHCDKFVMSYSKLDIISGYHSYPRYYTCYGARGSQLCGMEGSQFVKRKWYHMFNHAFMDVVIDPKEMTDGKTN